MANFQTKKEQQDSWHDSSLTADATPDESDTAACAGAPSVSSLCSPFPSPPPYPPRHALSHAKPPPSSSLVGEFWDAHSNLGSSLSSSSIQTYLTASCHSTSPQPLGCSAPSLRCLPQPPVTLATVEAVNRFEGDAKHQQFFTSSPDLLTKRTLSTLSLSPASSPGADNSPYAADELNGDPPPMGEIYEYCPNRQQLCKHLHTNTETLNWPAPSIQ
eukprot:GHVT01066244.1.p1 GENE.GHVT01066244.1~~GHVT01066244.1.p1  ORF type:complete len:216 (+),score=36.27 GHVT01066244.1:1411-2058(+)